jgi:DNA-binding NtrC family response regulator
MKSLLLVEDQEMDIELLRVALQPFLERFSVEMRICRRGLDALEEIRNNRHRLIILSYDLKGYVTGKSLLHHEDVQRHPVMLFSMLGEAELRAARRKFNNITDTFVKPIDLKAFRFALETFCSKHLA